MTEAGPQILPPFVAAASAGPDQARTLVLRPDGAALSYTVLRSTDPVLGEPELTEASSAARELDGVVASLAAAGGGDGGDAGQALRQFDIGYILLPAPVDQALASQLAGAAGLIRLTSGPAYDLWQVAGTVARASVIGPGGTAVPVPSGPVGVNTVLAASTSGTLVLAEPAGGWSATLNGKPLAPSAQPVDGWAQGFVLPAGGGRLVITRDETARDLSLGAEAVAVLVVLRAGPAGYQVRRGGRRRAGPGAGAGADGARERERPGGRAAAGPSRRTQASAPYPAAPVRLRRLRPAPRARCRRRKLARIHQRRSAVVRAGSGGRGPDPGRARLRTCTCTCACARGRHAQAPSRPARGAARQAPATRARAGRWRTSISSPPRRTPDARRS